MKRTNSSSSLAFALTVVGALSSPMTSIAQQGFMAGERGGNGGGGVIRDGSHLTFGSAKVKIRPEPMDQVPGLQTLTKAISGMPIDRENQGELLQAIFPLGERKYFRMNAADLGDDQRAELKRKYAKAVGAQAAAEELAIYAVTRGSETYLLPEFFQLSETEQAAILLHEAVWVISPELPYATVIDLEVEFQNYLESNGTSYPFEVALFTKLGEVLESKAMVLMAAAADDLAKGRLKRFLNAQGRLPISTIFGKQSMYCSREIYFRKDLIANHLIYAMTQYPEVRLFKVLYMYLDDLSVKVRFVSVSACDEFEKVLDTQGSISFWDFPNPDDRFSGYFKIFISGDVAYSIHAGVEL